MTSLPFGTQGQADFKIQQDLGIDRAAQYNTITYSDVVQNIPRGINNIEEIFTVRMLPLTQTERNTMDAFYDSHAGDFGTLPSAFDWLIVGTTTTGRFVFNSAISASLVNGDTFSISFSLRRVYNE